jgi:hypothetical protein
LADEGALSRPDLDETQALERAQRFPHRRAAHHELFGQVPLGRQAVAALEPALGDHRLHLPDDLLVDPRGLDGR